MIVLSLLVLSVQSDFSSSPETLLDRYVVERSHNVNGKRAAELRLQVLAEAEKIAEIVSARITDRKFDRFLMNYGEIATELPLAYRGKIIDSMSERLGSDLVSMNQLAYVFYLQFIPEIEGASIPLTSKDEEVARLLYRILRTPGSQFGNLGFLSSPTPDFKVEMQRKEVAAKVAFSIFNHLGSRRRFEPPRLTSEEKEILSKKQLEAIESLAQAFSEN